MPRPNPQTEAKRILARSAGKQPESIILDQCRAYLRLRGWLVFRHQQGLGCHKGFPDLTALKDGTTLYIECKTMRGRLSEHQKNFQAECERMGGRYLVARSVDDLMEVGL